MLERALLMTDTALIDARRRVRDLRASSMRADLPEHLRVKGESLLGRTTPVLKVSEDGRPRDLLPDVEREVAAVAEEAIFNAVKHADAAHIEVRISYSWRGLRLTISDDGKGIDPTALAQKADKHFGLVGMRERALRLRGSLTLQNRPSGGAEVSVMVPGPIAYGAFSWLFGGLSPST
jgi:signal transduction histidine kinase